MHRISKNVVANARHFWNARHDDARFCDDMTVEELSDRHSVDAQFKVIGPMPAHSFADHEWEAAPTAPIGDIVSPWA